MKRTLSLRWLAVACLLLALLGVCSAQAPPSSPLSYAVAYDIKAKNFTPIAAYRVTTFEDFAGRKGLNLDLCGVAGLDLSSTKPLGGIAVFWNKPLARNLDFGIGFGVTAQESRPTGAFVAFTFNVRL